MISTHILDTTKGSAAKGVKVILSRKFQGQWTKVSEGETNADGRFVFETEKVGGDYQIEFLIEEYFNGQEHFFLNTPVRFKISNLERKYHVPLLLNPYGFSTYRGT